MANEEPIEAGNGVGQACPDDVPTQCIDDCTGPLNDDDATVASAQYSLIDNASNEMKAAWALAKVSSIQPMNKVLSNRESRSSFFSDDDEYEEDEESNESASSEASMSSNNGLDNISVASDVILPFRYSYRTPLHKALHELGQPDDLPFDEREKTLVDQLDVTSDTSASSTPSSQPNGSSCESVYEADSDGADDADSDMTLGEAASQIIDYTNESDDDLDSKASSSRFTPDEFWDWLDNVQVAFIEVGKSNLPSKPKTRGVVSTDLSPERSSTASIHATEENEMDDQRCDSLRNEGRNEIQTNQSTPSHRGDEIPYGNEGDRFATSHVPLLRQSASVADFRSHTEQVQKEHNIRRTVSVADVAVDDSSRANELNDEGSARMRRISSNEDLLMTLHRRMIPSSAPVSWVNEASLTVVSGRKPEGQSAALVCFEPRVRMTSRLLVLFLAIYALAFTASNLANLFYEELPGTCEPRTVTIDLDNPFIPSFEEVRGTFEASASVAVDAIRLVKKNLPESLDEVNLLLEESKLSAFELYSLLKDHLQSSVDSLNPQMVRIDLPNYASAAYQEAVEVMKSSRTVLAGALHSRTASTGDQQWTESVDRLQSTLARARSALMKHLSELCRSSAIDGPKAAVFGACDALYESLATTDVSHNIPAEPGPPQLVFDLPFVQRSFDSLANETLAYIGRFATVVHDLCGEVQNHCQSNLSTAFLLHDDVEVEDSYSQSENATIVAPNTIQTANLAINHAEEPVVSKESVSERAAESARKSIDASFTKIAPPALGDHSNHSEGAYEGSGKVEVSQRVQDILSHLDAKGRLHELENLLVEKFGPDFVEPPPSTISFGSGYIGPIPLLGRERDRLFRERWLNSIEEEVVEATLRGQFQPFLSGFEWATHFMGHVLSLVGRNEAGKDRNADE